MHQPIFADPWPAPQHLWADPPWILSGTSITAWFETDLVTVEKLVSPSFKCAIGDKGVITRLRFYDIAFEPRDGSAEFKKKMSGRFKEAVIAFKGSFADIDGEFSAFMWTDDDVYMGWGREIFGWPLIRSNIRLNGTHWGNPSSEGTISRVTSDDFDLSLTIDESPGEEQALGQGANWLTPRRFLFLSEDEAERRDLNVVRPTILEVGNFFVHNGEVSCKINPNSIIAGLNPLMKPIIHRHSGFKICVGDNVKTIRGVN